MKHTGTPANRLTADCIWNSFRSSGKKHLILTGNRGCGKTTLLRQLFPSPCAGITTWAQPMQAVYLKENTSGRTVQVGVFDPTLPGTENRMALASDGFDALGIPALIRCMNSPEPWITIDEIGYLECQSMPYQHTLLDLMAAKQVAAVVRKQDLPFLQALCNRDDAFIVDLDAPFGNIGCVIMASGLGQRFGSNKLMADFHGAPMISRILDATEGIFAQRVVVTRHADVAQLCQARNIQTVLHTLPYRNDTVRLGLDAMHGTERCMFAAADQPLLRKATVMSLALAARNDPQAIWRVVSGDTPGSPVIFPSWAYPALSALPQGKGGGAVIRQYPQALRTLPVANILELRDVDTPEDLAELLAAD